MGIAPGHLLLLIALLSLCWVSSGCHVVRYSPELDRELTPQALEFLKHNSVVIAENQERGSWVDPDSGRVVVPSEGKITIMQNCSRSPYFHNTLTLLTLGVVPFTTRDEFSFVARYEAGGKAYRLGQKYSYESFSGWFAPVQWLFSGWEFGGGPPPAERAFNTVVNRFVALRSGAKPR